MDLMLDTTNHDLIIKNGDLVLATKIDAIEQNLKQNYLFFFGEWYLDNTQGVPYYQFIFVKNPNLDLVEATLRQVALQTPGILALKSFNFSYDNTLRALNPSFEAQSTDGDINFLAKVEV